LRTLCDIEGDRRPGDRALLVGSAGEPIGIVETTAVEVLLTPDTNMGGFHRPLQQASCLEVVMAGTGRPGVEQRSFVR